MSKSIVEKQGAPVKLPSAQELQEFVEMVLRTMEKRGELHGPREDAFQWAALAVWEGIVLRRVPLEPGNRAYHFRAARLKVLYQLRRAACPASVYDRYARRAPIGHDPLVGCGYVADPDEPGSAIEVSGGSAPDAQLAAVEERAARADLASRVLRCLDAETPRARQVVRVALGRDSDTPVGDAAWLTAGTVLEVNAALQRVGKRVKADPEAVELRRRVAELAA